MSKSIFEINDESTLSLEIIRLDWLIHDRYFTVTDYLDGDMRGTIESFADMGFYKWPYRGTYVNTSDMRKHAQIDVIVKKESPSIDEFITFLEYALAVFDALNYYDRRDINNERVVITAFDNIKLLMERHNLEIIKDSKERFMIVQSDPSIESVIESLNNESSEIQLRRYHHHSLKGNLQEKSMILSVLAKQFESTKHVLQGKGFEKLRENISYVLNNMNIRHAIKEENSLFEQLNDHEIEVLYDTTYDMLLLWFQAVNYYQVIEDGITAMRKNQKNMVQNT